MKCLFEKIKKVIMGSINKNTDIVGVSDSIKLSGNKLSPINSSVNQVNQVPQTKPLLVPQAHVNDEPHERSIVDNKITINPSSSCDDSSALSISNLKDNNNSESGRLEIITLDEPSQTCGWLSFRPRILRRFMNPRWALAFLCLAGATQGLCYFKK